MRVVDASPLIHLARVSLLELLRGSDQSIAVTVPAVVLDEVLRGAWHEPGGGMFESRGPRLAHGRPDAHAPPRHQPGEDRCRRDRRPLDRLGQAFQTPTFLYSSVLAFAKKWVS